MSLNDTAVCFYPRLGAQLLTMGGKRSIGLTLS